MAKDSADQGVQAATVAPTGSALLSMIYPYGNQPPRLIAALNDTITDCPAEGTLFGSYGQARKKSDELRSKPKGGPKYPSAVGQLMADLPVPLAHVIHLKDGDKKLASAPIPKLVQTDELQPVELSPPDAIGQILDWVTRRLDTPWDFIWNSQLGPTLVWRTADPEHVTDPAAIDAAAKDEEAWARVVTQLLMAVDYAGVADLYAMGAVGASTPPGESWEQFVYRRIEPESIIPQPYKRDVVEKDKQGKLVTKARVHGGHHVKSWLDPRWEPVAEKPSPTHVKQTNEDPAAPITAACQHSATLVALMRGYPLYWMGDLVNNAVGFMASAACRDLAIFGKDYSKHDKSPFGDAKDLVPPVPAGGAWCPASSAPVIQHILKPETAKTDEEKAYPPAVPGTVFVWDPDADLHEDATLYMTWYERNYRYNPTISKFLATRSGVGKGDFSKAWQKPNGRTPPAEEVPDDKKIDKLKKDESTTITALDGLIAAEKKKANPNNGQIKMWEQAKKNAEGKLKGLEAGLGKSTATTEQVTYRRDKQLPGSHINAILRVSFTKDALQLFDTGLGSGVEILARTGSEAIVPVNGGGTTCDGYRQPSGPTTENAGAVAQEDSNQQLSAGTGKQYAGYGVPPPSPRALADQTAFLSKARSIGLMRFALTRRLPALINTNDVLFVSTLRMMYGRGETERYPLAKLLWSLRNTPGFTNLQAWWLVYVPRGLLAKCMWAHKPTADEAKAAGDMPQMMMLEDFKAHYGKSQFANDLSVLRFFQRHEPLQWPPKEGKEMEEAQQRAVNCKLYDGKHYFLVEAFTNHGSDSPAYAGKAHLFTRYRYEEGKTMPQMNGGFEWFKVLKNLAGKLSWDDMWLSPEIHSSWDAIAGKLAPFFPAPANSPPPPAKKKG